jgi:ABC-type glycerol-3-phosphate transport system substrate-binding protein
MLVPIVVVLALALPAQAQDKKAVRIWHTETEPQSVKAFQEIINDFEKLRPDITVKQEALAWGDLEAKLTAALAAGAPPDASHGQAFTCASFYHKGLLRDQEDIANAVGKDNIFEVARNLCRFDGKHPPGHGDRYRSGDAGPPGGGQGPGPGRGADHQVGVQALVATPVRGRA